MKFNIGDLVIFKNEDLCNNPIYGKIIGTTSVILGFQTKQMYQQISNLKDSVTEQELPGTAFVTDENLELYIPKINTRLCMN